jgi:hypothetical protein
MRRFALIFLLVCVAGDAGATGASLPPVGKLEFKLGTAQGHLVITPAEDLAGVVVQVYGLDGLRAGADDMVWARYVQLHKGQAIELPFAVARGSGRTDLVTFAQAGGRQSQLTIRVGEESAEQRRRRSACVKKDADGQWIEEMGCPERGPEPVVPRPGPAPTVEVSGAADVFVDGEHVVLAPSAPLFVKGCPRADAERVAGEGAIRLPGGPMCPSACVAAPRLETWLPDGKRGGKWHAAFATFNDAQCRDAAPLELTVERGPSPNKS